MPGSKTNAMNRKQVLSAVRALTRGQDYVWDGKDKHDHLILFCKILLIFFTFLYL